MTTAKSWHTARMLKLNLASPVLVAGALALAGCATGQAWVQQPEDALSVTASPELERVAASERESLSLVQAATPSFAPTTDAPRHRLDHVVSLGEGAAGAPAPGVAPSSGPAPMIVNIVNYAAPSYGYAAGTATSYPAAAYLPSPGGASRAAPVSVIPQGTPPLAHDWQAPRSYGPNFPYHTGPASPWERAR